MRKFVCNEIGCCILMFGFKPYSQLEHIVYFPRFMYCGWVTICNADIGHKWTPALPRGGPALFWSDVCGNGMHGEGPWGCVGWALSWYNHLG